MTIKDINSTIVKSHRKYPKILILSRVPFNFNNGTGIALSVLFQSWPKNKIAQVYAKANDNVSDTEICDNYYQLGAVELPRQFPVNFYDNFREKKFSGNSKGWSPGKDINGLHRKHEGIRFRSLKSRIGKILQDYGWLYPKDCFLSKELRVYLDKFSPDLIFSVPAELAFVRLTSQISEYLNIPVAVQVYDNWTPMHYRRGIGARKKRQQLDLEFRTLLKNSAIRFGICDLMCKAYTSKYGKAFHPLPVSVNTNLWYRPQAKWDKKPLPFRIVYAGSIHKHAAFSGLADMSRVVEQLTKNGMHVEFNILGSQDTDVSIKNKLGGEYTKFSTFHGQNELIEQISTADLLFLPVAFDKDSWEFIKYSFPAKSAAYMASGVPILVYARKESAIALEARTHGVAYVVDEPDIKMLEAGVKNMLTNEQERLMFSQTAIEHSRKYYDKEIVSAQAHGQLFDVILRHQK